MISIFPWQFFKQHKLITFIVLSGITLLCCLGFWQLSRAAQKENLAHQIALGMTSSALSKEALKSHVNESMRFKRISLHGHFINELTILLDNKFFKGHPGYHVIVPFAWDGIEHVILIDRGWIPMGRSRKMLPTPTPIKGQVTIEGYLDFAYRNPFIKHAVETETIEWPLRMQDLDLILLKQLTGKNLHQMLVRLEKNSHYGFEIVDLMPTMTSARHRGYAFQWFSLAGALFLLTFLAAKHAQHNKP